MITEPILGLVGHLFSTPRPQLDMLVAGGIVICTVIYMARIAGISVSYGMNGSKSAKELDPAQAEKSYEGPYLAG